MKTNHSNSRCLMKYDKKKDHYETYEISDIFPFRIFEANQIESL